MAKLSINGQALEIAMSPDTPLLFAIRDAANLTGTKQGCGGSGRCGACTVIVDGAAVLSCTLAIGTLEGAEVTTIEGLQGHPVVAALVAEDAIQCGYCTPGFACAAAALLRQSPRPAPAQIDALPNLCSCGCQPRLRRAVMRAAASVAVAAAAAPPASSAGSGTPPAPPPPVAPEVVPAR